MTTHSNGKAGGRPGFRLGLWGAIAALVLAPLVAMGFTHEVAWTAFDFAVFGGLLVGAGALYELAAWRVKAVCWRIGIGLALAASVLLLWADGAVGVF